MASHPNGQSSQWPVVPVAGHPSGPSSQWLALLILEEFSVGAVAELPEQVGIDRVTQKLRRPVSKRELSSATVKAAESAHVERSEVGIGFLAPLITRFESAGVAERGASPRGPTERSRAGDELSDQNRLRTAVEDLAVANLAVQEEQAVVVGVDRYLAVVVTPGVVRGSSPTQAVRAFDDGDAGKRRAEEGWNLFSSRLRIRRRRAPAAISKCS